MCRGGNSRGVDRVHLWTVSTEEYRSNKPETRCRRDTDAAVMGGAQPKLNEVSYARFQRIPAFRTIGGGAPSDVRADASL